MKKVVTLTESDLIKIVKRVVKEESSPKEKDLYTSLHSLRNSINDIKAPSLLKDKKEALSKLEDILSTVRDMEDKPKSKRKVNENRDEEKDIFISAGFKGVRDYIGQTASPQSIIELYNETVEADAALVKYLGRDIFLNTNDEEVDKYTVLEDLDDALLSDEQINYGDEEEEEDDDMPSYKTKWRMPSDDDNNRQSFEDTGRHLGWFNPKRWNDM